MQSHVPDNQQAMGSIPGGQHSLRAVQVALYRAQLMHAWSRDVSMKSNDSAIFHCGIKLQLKRRLFSRCLQVGSIAEVTRHTHAYYIYIYIYIYIRKEARPPYHTGASMTCLPDNPDVMTVPACIAKREKERERGEHLEITLNAGIRSHCLTVMTVTHTHTHKHTLHANAPWRPLFGCTATGEKPQVNVRAGSLPRPCPCRNVKTVLP